MINEKDEVLRYLGRRGQEAPPGLNAMVDECISLLRGKLKPRHVKREFRISHEDGGVVFIDAGLMLAGEDISRRLDGCVRAVLFAATLGAEADSVIRLYERVDITRALVLDACASHMIEDYCGKVQETVLNEAKHKGFAITSRYSPGYGDLSLEIQPKLLAVLDAERKIGLTCSESNIMLPRKSVTAIIGIGEKPREKAEGCGRSCNSCRECSLNKTCAYRSGI